MTDSILGRNGPAFHHGQGIAGLMAWLCLSPEGSTANGPKWLNQLPPRSTSRALILSISTSTPSMYYLWELVKGLALWIYSCRISVTQGNNGYSRGVSMRVQHWWSTQRLRTNQQYTTHWKFASEDEWTRGQTAQHSAAPNARKTEEEVMERWERGRSKVLCWFACFVLFWINIFLKLSFVGDTVGLRDGYGGTGKRVGLGCLMWNSQAINKNISKLRKRHVELSILRHVTCKNINWVI